MSAFVSFWVGCLVGAVTGVMAMALVIVARDAEERAQRMNEERLKGEENEEKLH